MNCRTKGAGESWHRHNRFRSELGIEKQISTKTSHFRVFFSLLGIIVVDAWLMHKHSRLEDDIKQNMYKILKDFTAELAVELCLMDSPETDFYPRRFRNRFISQSQEDKEKTLRKKTTDRLYRRRYEIENKDG